MERWVVDGRWVGEWKGGWVSGKVGGRAGRLVISSFINYWTKSSMVAMKDFMAVNKARVI